MGIYYKTIIYYGFRLPKHIINNTINKNYILEDNIIYLPETYYKFNTIEQVITDGDINNGYVDKNHINTYIIDSNEKYIIDSFANDLGIKEDNVGYWIVEYISSTMDYPIVTTLTKILPIK